MTTENINKLLDTLTEKEQVQLYQFILALKQETASVADDGHRDRLFAGSADDGQRGRL